MLAPLALGIPEGWELILIALVALLIFGKRLPEVGRSVGKGIVEFKKGLSGIDDDPKNSPPAQTIQPPQQQIAQPQPYKFDPYTGKPLDSNATPPSTPATS